MKQYAKYLPFQKVRVILKVNVVITLQGLKIISNILKPKKGGGRVEPWEPTTIFRMVIDHTNLFFHNCMHIFELESQGNYFQKDNGVAILKQQ